MNPNNKIRLKFNLARRDFFRWSAQAAVVVSIPSFFTKAFSQEEKRRGGGPPSAGSGPLNLPEVIPGKGPAAGLHYILDHKDLKDQKLKLERNGVSFDKQFCHNCNFYKKVGDKGGKELGTCTIFPNQLVQSKAWCQTWTKKA